MCLTEYNEAETMEMFKEEGREEGVREGHNSLLDLLLADGTLTPERAESLRKMTTK